MGYAAMWVPPEFTRENCKREGETGIVLYATIALLIYLFILMFLDRSAEHDTSKGS